MEVKEWSAMIRIPDKEILSRFVWNSGKRKQQQLEGGLEGWRCSRERGRLLSM